MKWSPLILRLALISLLAVSIPSLAAQGDATEPTQATRKVTNRVVPSYPAMARPLALSGTVKLEALVLPNGTIKSIQVVGGNPLLVQSAQNAIREWKWEKAEHETTELVEFHFHP
jgi:TonB family protein